MDTTTVTHGRGGRAGSSPRWNAEANRDSGKPLWHRPFHRPIIVQTGRIDRERVILTTRDAAQVLLRDWPLSQSYKRARAMELCLGVIRGEKPPHLARRALVEAAREARVLIDE